MKEHAVTFGTMGSIVGVVTEAAESAPRRASVGVILLNAGILHHVGPNRLYVTIARELAKSGFTVVRFDFSGIGDSTARIDTLPFERSAMTEVNEVMERLSTVFGIDYFIVGGLCSGAVMAFNAACSDQRVIGAIMVNAQEFISDDVLTSYVKVKASSTRVWHTALFSRNKWLRLLRGQINGWGLLALLGNRLASILLKRKRVARSIAPVYSNFRLLAERKVDLLLVYSDEDPGLTELEMVFSRSVDRIREDEGRVIEIVHNTDHTFSALSSQTWLVNRIREWSQELVSRFLSPSV